MSPISKKSALTIVLLVLIAVNIVALATFIFWPHLKIHDREKSCDQKEHPREFMKKVLNLSPEQGDQMKQIRESHTDTIAFWQLKMKEKRLAVAQEMMKEKPDSNLIDSLSIELGDIYGNIRKLNVEHYWHMRAICSKEQQEKLDSVFLMMFCCDEPMFERFEKHRKSNCPASPEMKCNNQ